MNIVNSMTDVTVVESLGISVLGMLVVFLVLVFLMAIIYIMTAIIRIASNKPAAAGETSLASAPALPAETPQTDQAVAATAAIAQASAATEPAVPPKPSVPKKYRVIVNGTEYEVDAETGDAAASPTVSEPETPAVSVDAAPEAAAVRPSARASTLEFSGIRKFKVVIDSKEYEVDAEMGETVNKPVTGRAQ